MTNWISSVITVELAVLAWTIACWQPDALHPGVLQAGLWSLICGLHAWAPVGYRNVSEETALLVGLSSVAFGLASMGRRQGRGPVDPPALETTGLRPALFWVSLVGLPLFVLKALELAQSAEFTDSFFINLRIALTREDDDALSYGLAGYLVPAAFASTVVELAASRTRLFERRGWCSLLLSIAYALMGTGRTYIFMLFIALAFIALVQRRVTPRQLALGGAAFVGLGFFGLGMLVNKIGASNDNTASRTALDAFLLYALSGLAAFDLSMVTPPSLEWGANVMRSPLAVLRALGFDLTVPPLVKEYVWVPEPTNVYTVFQPYVRDFGWAGAIGFLSLFGALHGMLYRRAMRGDARFAVLYGMSVYPLLMQFFQDQYMSLMTTWVEFVVLLVPCFRVPARRGPLKA